MKLRVLLGSLAWALLITVAHVQLNVGWATLEDRVQVKLGTKRAELIIGFLPVT